MNQTGIAANPTAVEGMLSGEKPLMQVSFVRTGFPALDFCSGIMTLGKELGVDAREIEVCLSFIWTLWKNWNDDVKQPNPEYKSVRELGQAMAGRRTQINAIPGAGMPYASPVGMNAADWDKMRAEMLGAAFPDKAENRGDEAL